MVLKVKPALHDEAKAWPWLPNEIRSKITHLHKHRGKGTLGLTHGVV